MAAKHSLRGLVAHYGGTLSVRLFSRRRLAPPGQQIGQGPAPRYLWPLTQVFHPPVRVAIGRPSNSRLNGRDPRRGPQYSGVMKAPALASILVAAAVLVLGAPACAAQKAPEFTHSSQAEWLNSKPLRLAQ